MSRGGVRILFALAAVTLVPFPASAGQSSALCAAAKKPVEANPLLASAVAAAFGKAPFTATAEGCLYPLKVLPYPGAELLVVQAGEPGQACHGCAAPLSAYVLRKFAGGPKLVRVYRTFAMLGTFGAVGDISAVQIAGDDGMAIQSGGMFQGCGLEALTFTPFTQANSASSTAGWL
jgi:hypothetical protein